MIAHLFNIWSSANHFHCLFFGCFFSSLSHAPIPVTDPVFCCAHRQPIRIIGAHTDLIKHIMLIEWRIINHHVNPLIGKHLSLG